MVKPKLDCGSGNFPASGYVHLDKRKLPHVDIVWDVEHIPWMVVSESYCEVRMSHLIEHIKPWLTIEIIDECWRVLKKNGLLRISAPYATSPGFYADPTHCNQISERWVEYFDPDYPLYTVYSPKPWKVTKNEWNPDLNIDIVLRKIK